ncbi:hypothetical protein ACLK1T_05535 [Escherichia coli]
MGKLHALLMPAMARHQVLAQTVNAGAGVTTGGFCGFIRSPLQLPVFVVMVCGFRSGRRVSALFFAACALDHLVQPVIAVQLAVYAGNWFIIAGSLPGFLACCVVSAAIT